MKPSNRAGGTRPSDRCPPRIKLLNIFFLGIAAAAVGPRRRPASATLVRLVGQSPLGKGRIVPSRSVVRSSTARVVGRLVGAGKPGRDGGKIIPNATYSFPIPDRESATAADSDGSNVRAENASGIIAWSRAADFARVIDLVESENSPRFPCVSADTAANRRATRLVTVRYHDDVAGLGWCRTPCISSVPSSARVQTRPRAMLLPYLLHLVYSGIPTILNRNKPSPPSPFTLTRPATRRGKNVRAETAFA